MKNIVFDLGGVVFARDPQKCEREFIDFFSFVAREDMPEFWVNYDRGAVSYDDVVKALCEYHGCRPEVAERHMRTAIGMQKEIPWTRELIADLKGAGYRLYVLSNMSKEFIEYLRRFGVYSMFDGEVVSCEEHAVKPEKRIFEILLSRYGLRPEETLFVDDRPGNVVAAEKLGMNAFLFDYRNPRESCERLRGMLLG